MARRGTKPFEIRVYSEIWRDDEFTALSAAAQLACIKSVAYLGMRRSLGGEQFTHAELGLDVFQFDAVSRELVTLGVWTWVDEYTVEVWPYKDFIVPHEIRFRTAIPAAVRSLVFARDGHQCRTCAATDRLEIDHIFPWSEGGSDDETNLQTLCRSCNWRKGASTQSGKVPT